MPRGVEVLWRFAPQDGPARWRGPVLGLAPSSPARPVSTPLSPRLKLLRRDLAAAAVRGELRRIGGKLLRRARRVERRSITLEPAGPPRGWVLFSFIVDPFLAGGEERISHAHTHDWESWQMARTFLELGFGVDAIHWTNHGFAPRRDYAVFVDVRLNMERFAPRLPVGCLKILHAETSHYTFHNGAQRRRLEALERRRGLRLAPYKLVEANRAAEWADCITLLGNAVTASTYAFAGKPIWPVPISAPFTYPAPEAKDFDRCRRSFLWFGSGGLVHKGLDVALEAFAGMPDFRLFVCGPVRREREFERAFYRELYATPNIRAVGWTDVGSRAFLEVVGECLGLVYPSCSEGQSGGVVTCLHAGLVPVVSDRTGVDIAPDVGLVLEDCSVERVRGAIRALAGRPAAELREMALAGWRYARARHTRERFAAAYREAVEAILARREARPTASGAGG